ncbi:hypothetical protein GJAV_G00069660 [Gymnothorax javanicus]|nr:hypothetical protein GJAV_G00069660 [Gymnothorax javanicus]
MTVEIAPMKLVLMQIAQLVGQDGGTAFLCCTSIVSVSLGVCARTVEQECFDCLRAAIPKWYVRQWFSVVLRTKVGTNGDCPMLAENLCTRCDGGEKIKRSRCLDDILMRPEYPRLCDWTAEAVAGASGMRGETSMETVCRGETSPIRH